MMNTFTHACALTQGRLNERQTNEHEGRMSKAERHAALDGQTHINIDRLAKTSLGQQLNSMALSPFVHPEFGSFASVEGFVGYIRSGMENDQCRMIYGLKSRYVSRRQNFGAIPGYREIVLEAHYQKIRQNQGLLPLVRESVLPFEHYYVNEHGVLTPQTDSYWFVPGMEYIRRLIKLDQPYPRPSYNGLYEAIARARD